MEQRKKTGVWTLNCCVWSVGRSRSIYTVLIHLVVLSFVVISGSTAQNTRDLDSDSSSQVYYTRIDELPGNVVVGNVLRESGLDKKYSEDVLDTFVMEIIGGRHMEYFQMDPNVIGNLKTAKFVDRDWVCRNIEECVIELDIAVVRPVEYFHIIQLTLTLLDNNDNSPEFSQPETTVYISENALPPVSFVLPTANDPDSGQYGIQTYQFVRRSSKFDLELIENSDGTKDLRLKLLSRLNREEQSSYSLQVRAQDGGLPPKSGFLDIQVIVSDANDNTPEFERAVYNVSIPENQVTNSPFLQVRANDPDEGPNGLVIYSLAAQTMESYGHIFTIDRETGELSLLTSLDYEEQTSYHLLVTAQDQGPDSVPVHVRVVIQVLDVNDFVPKISVNSWTSSGLVEVKENDEAGFVAHVTVVDEDKGQSGVITCHVSDPRFALELMYGNTYKLMTTVALDRESVELTEISVQCVDQGVPPLSATSEVEIHVLDENDHAPLFSQTLYTESLPETSHIGVSVLRVSASDKDSGSNAVITYHLHANSQNLLHVDPSTGVITTSSLLDHETMSHIEFFVLAIDGGSPAHTSTATVSLVITDVNDEAPVFSQPSYNFGTFENQRPNTEIATIQALDTDAPPNDAFIFSLNDNSTFDIHPISGVITTKKVLDREHQSAYYLVIYATDTEPPFLSSTVSLTIYVADRNDNAPRISFPREGNNTVEVSAFAPEGYVLSRVLASDADLGNNAKLEYSFARGNDEDLFEVDPVSGILTVQGDLSDTPDDNYNLLVLVQDSGETQKSAVASLNIIVNRTKEFATFVSLPPSGGEEETVGLGYHEKILIIIGAITLVVVSLLVVAIICIKRRQGGTERDSYKYMCRVDMANAINQAKVECPQDQSSVTGSGINKDRMVQFNMEHPTPAHDDSFNSMVYPPGSFQEKPVSMGTNSPVDPPPPYPPKQACPVHGSKNLEMSTYPRPANIDKMHPPIVHRDPHDSDSTSGCSADMSNSDSGRGPSEEGDRRYHTNSHSNSKQSHPDHYTDSHNGSLSRKHGIPAPNLPPRTSSLHKQSPSSKTGCHGYRTGCHGNQTNDLTSSPSSPSQNINKNPVFRNVTANFGGDKPTNFSTFSPPRPVRIIQKGAPVNVSGDGINV